MLPITGFLPSSGGLVALTKEVDLPESVSGSYSDESVANPTVISIGAGIRDETAFSGGRFTVSLIRSALYGFLLIDRMIFQSFDKAESNLRSPRTSFVRNEARYYR